MLTVPSASGLCAINASGKLIVLKVLLSCFAGIEVNPGSKVSALTDVLIEISKSVADKYTLPSSASTLILESIDFISLTVITPSTELIAF